MDQLLKKNEAEKVNEYKVSQIEARKTELEKEIAEERRLREIAEKKNSELEESINRSHAKVADLEKLWKKLNSDYESLNKQNKELYDQVQKFSNERDHNLQEQQKRYEQKIKSLNDEINKMNGLAKEIEQNHEDNLQSVKSEWSVKCQKLDEQVQQLNSMVEKLNSEHEQEIKRVKAQVQQQENEKIQRVFREIGERLKDPEQRDVYAKRQESTANLNESRLAKSQEGLDTSKQDSKTPNLQYMGTAEKEIEKILKENRLLKNQLVEALKINEELEQEVGWKENTISKLEEDVAVLQTDGSRTKEEYHQDVEKLGSTAKEERRTWEQTQKSLKEKIEQLEASIGTSQEENAKVRREYDQLKRLLQGNITKVISKTFSEHETASSRK